MHYSYQGAAEFLSGVEKYGTISKDKVHRAVKAGELSRGQDGIEKSELIRWADGLKPVKAAPAPGPETVRDASAKPSETVFLRQELEGLRDRLSEMKDGHRREVERLMDQVGDLQKRLDDESTERRQLTRMLVAPKEDQEDEKPKKRGLFGFRRSA